MTEDLKSVEFPKCDWQAKNTGQCLEELQSYSIVQGELASKWYLEKRRSKKMWGIALRSCALVLTAVAGIIPILVQMSLEDDKLLVRPGWAAVALALAALMVALDRFWGCTNSWIRYMTAQQDVTNVLTDFRLTWEKERAELGGSSPNLAQTKAMIEMCEKFLRRLNHIIGAETQQWANEFSRIVQQLDARLKDREGKPKLSDIR